MSDILNEIIELLTSGIGNMATGIGAGLNNLVQEIFIRVGENGEYGLSVFGGITVVFAGIALAIGLSKLVFHFVRGLGK